ncbi:MAG: EamA family transporter [Rhizobiaceae bacterium]|nr:EamA family transporter [Rhizobiaceae bacterium]
MNRAAPNLRNEIALLIVLAILWGSSYLFIKIAVTEIPPFTLIAVRVSIAALFLLLVMAWQKERFPRDAKTWRMLFIQAILNSIAAWTVLAWGQQYIDSGMASVLNSTSPIFIFMITVIFTRHEPAGKLKLCGACIGMFGVVMIVGVDALDGFGDHVLGQLAALTGALLYAGAAIYGKRFAHLSPTVTSAGTMIWASICLVPLAFFVDRPWELAPSGQAVFATLVLSVACTGIALLIYFRLVNTLGSLGVASQAYLRAGVGVLLGIIFLGEHITHVIGVGLAAAIIGVAAINWPKPR